MNRHVAKITVVLATIVIVGSVGSTLCQAAIIASENFESYADGGTVIGGSGGSGWTQPWIGNTTTGAPLAIASPGKIAGYSKSLELAATADNRGIAVREFPSQNGTFYVGFVLQTSNGWDGDFFSPYFNATYATPDSTTPSFTAGLLNDPGLNRYFVRKGPATAGVGTTNNSTLQHTSLNNDIHTFVVKLSKSTGLPGDLYDQIALFVDQSAEGTPTAVLGAADIGTAALNSATISAIHFRVSSLEASDRVYLDNLTVSTAYAEAVPEPTGLMLLCTLSTSMLGFRSLRLRRAC